MAANNRKYADPIVFVGVIVLALVVGVSWSFRSSDFIAGSFRIEEIYICDELDENLRPMNIGASLPPGSQQVCLWFGYSKARRGDLIEIAWYLGETMIQRETLRLSESMGVKAFYLLREDGSSLEPGLYSVHISCNGRERTTVNFEIIEEIEESDVFFLLGDDTVIYGVVTESPEAD